MNLSLDTYKRVEERSVSGIHFAYKGYLQWLAGIMRINVKPLSIALSASNHCLSRREKIYHGLRFTSFLRIISTNTLSFLFEVASTRFYIPFSGPILRQRVDGLYRHLYTTWL